MASNACKWRAKKMAKHKFRKRFRRDKWERQHKG
jgi:hypothetical protein